MTGISRSHRRMFLMNQLETSYEKTESLPDTVLHGEDTFLAENVQLGLEVVGGLSLGRVLEEDERETGRLVDLLVTSLGSALLVAESKPAVGRVEETGRGTSLFGPLGLETGDVVALASDTGDDGDGGGLDKGLDDLDLLVRGEEGALTSVTEHDEALDALDGPEPRPEALNSLKVDRPVLVEGGDGGGSETGHVEADTLVGGVGGTVTVDRRHVDMCGRGSDWRVKVVGCGEEWSSVK